MAKARNFSPWAYWMLRLQSDRATDPCPVEDPSALADWRERARARLRDLLGPEPERIPLDLEVRDSTDCGTYRRDSIVFDSEAAMSVPAFLLVPHDRQHPGSAVLAVHGHGPGKSEICGIDGEEGGDYAHQLAELGYVVLAPDLRCFGERADWAPPDKYLCDLNLVHAHAAGANPLAQNLWDLARALDVLGEDPLVDPTRIGVAGFSYGATMTLFLTATDERVRAAVVSGYFNAWSAAHEVPWNLCGSQVLSGMLTAIEHVDLGALAAPRALLVESGTEDLIFPVDAARTEMARLKSVYDAFGEADALEHAVFDGGHEWHGGLVEGFLARHLGPAA
ncbi:MAG: hypothetical protein FJW86_03940 [Actinobacteria bacterium]|nr:hypothetical protein [Actinomycetota bacterium]